MDTYPRPCESTNSKPEKAAKTERKWTKPKSCSDTNAAKSTVFELHISLASNTEEIPSFPGTMDFSSRVPWLHDLRWQHTTDCAIFSEQNNNNSDR